MTTTVLAVWRDRSHRALYTPETGVTERWGLTRGSDESGPTGSYGNLWFLVSGLFKKDYKGCGLVEEAGASLEVGLRFSLPPPHRSDSSYLRTALSQPLLQHHACCCHGLT